MQNAQLYWPNSNRRNVYEATLCWISPAWTCTSLKTEPAKRQVLTPAGAHAVPPPAMSSAARLLSPAGCARAAAPRAPAPHQPRRSGARCAGKKSRFGGDANAGDNSGGGMKVRDTRRGAEGGHRSQCCGCIARLCHARARAPRAQLGLTCSLHGQKPT